MRWAFLGAAVCSFAILLGVGPRYGVYAAFLVMCVNFATLCLQYDDPIKRARSRIAAQLRGLSPHSDVAQRLETAVVKPTEEDRRLQFGLMTLLNLVTGLAAIGLLIWGIVLWVL
jgi:hypothetical protein